MGDVIELKCTVEIDGTAYRVMRLSLDSAIDELPVLELELTDGADGPAPGGLVRGKLELSIQRAAGGEELKFVGYVTEAEATTVVSDEVRGTRVVAHPRWFHLRHRTNCRIFQEMSAPDIVKKVVADAGIPEGEQRWLVTESYPSRVYVSQYRETDEAFVKRLLAEEGIGFFIDSSSGVDEVVFFDGAPDPIAGDAEIPFVQHGSLTQSSDNVSGLHHQHSMASGKVYLRDYDFERPKLELNAKFDEGSDEEKQLEIYDYPGRFVEQADGDRFAKVLLQATRARRELIDGTSSTLRLRAGFGFTLTEHPYAPLNREYLVVSMQVRHDEYRPREDEPASSSLRFVATPTDNAYRPQAIARGLSTPGAQVAVTTGPPGKEIHPDQHGRVKVLFPWDRENAEDDTSSCWMRTCQLPLGGSMLTPRVGWEAYLNFIDGDVDQPFVFGRLYNAEKPPPYALPENKSRMSVQTATTPGGGSTNEFRMEDKAGSEEMFMNASKDASMSAKNNATEDVGNNETRSVGANQNINVTDSLSNKVGADQSLTVGANQAINVSTFCVDDVGSHTMTVGGSRDIKAGGDHNRTITGASTLKIGGMQIDLVAGSYDDNGLATMAEDIGAALVEMTASDRTITAKGARTESAGAAKAILCSGGRAVNITGNLDHKVAGAILTKIKGGREDASSADFLEVAAGAQLVKATNVVFEAKNLLSVVMGGSTITLTPASVSIAGTNITLDGECAQLSALIGDN